MKISALPPPEVTAALLELNASGQPAWVVSNAKLTRKFQFPDFVTAFGFMSQAALIAERMNHHPEWFNVYGSVVVELITHDASGITKLDFELAAAMNKIAAVAT